MTFAVVDDGGHLLAFGRMDGARPSSVATALARAVSAATDRPASGVANDPSSAPIKGALPIMVDGQVIGALGASGGVGDQDLEVARAGLAAFLEGLQVKPPEEPKVESKPKDSEGGQSSKPVESASPKPVEADTSPR